MSQVEVEQLILEVVAGTVRNAVSNFLTERRARGLSPRTIGFYQDVLGRFCRWLDDVGVVRLDELTPDVIRQFLLYLEARGNNPGGRHVYYRSIKAFLNWWEWENEGEYHNPIKRVMPPKVMTQPLPGISLEDARSSEDIQKTLLRLTLKGGRRACPLRFMAGLRRRFRYYLHQARRYLQDQEKCSSHNRPVHRLGGENRFDNLNLALRNHTERR